MIIPILKKAALYAIDKPAIGSLLAMISQPRASIIMLHRFAGNEQSTSGADPAAFRAFLEYLRRVGVKLVQLDELVQSAYGENFEVTSPQVAITVDDGYQDFCDVGAPIFADFDCPVTVFVTPDVIDGKTWFWWDEISWIQRHSEVKSVTIEIDGAPTVISWHTDRERIDTTNAFSDKLKTVSNDTRLKAIAELSQRASVAIPAELPPEYRVMSWDQIRSVESKAVRFGAHTMTHPILNRCSDDQARYEIVESVRRVASEVRNPSTVFCYPNGRPVDFGEREMNLVLESGLNAAVSTIAGRIEQKTNAANRATSKLRIPRLAYDERRGASARAILSK